MSRIKLREADIIFSEGDNIIVLTSGGTFNKRLPIIAIRHKFTYLSLSQGAFECLKVDIPDVEIWKEIESKNTQLHLVNVQADGSLQEFENIKFINQHTFKSGK